MHSLSVSRVRRCNNMTRICTTQIMHKIISQYVHCACAVDSSFSDSIIYYTYLYAVYVTGNYKLSEFMGCTYMEPLIPLRTSWRAGLQPGAGVFLEVRESSQSVLSDIEASVYCKAETWWSTAIWWGQYTSGEAVLKVLTSYHWTLTVYCTCKQILAQLHTG